MNLELPFAEPESPELDALLAALDRELDALFLDAVSGALERISPEGGPPPGAAAA